MSTLGMSDEDFMNAPEPELPEESPVEEAQPQEEYEYAEPEEQLETDTEEVEESYEESEEQVPEEEEDSQDEEPKENTESNDLGLERILQPFKANGSDVQARNVDEAIQLMQMGANYTKKMQALQPNLKVLKTLEKNNLLDGDKLNYLIDLSNKDPKAIAKLVKDAEIDPMDLEDEVEYTPNNHQVSDNAVQLEQVLEQVESTPTGSKCIDIIGNQWDDGSKELLTKEPHLIAQLNEQMQMGIFDQIQAEVEHVRMFGGLSDKSNFEAYRIVGAQMYQEGRLGQPQQPAPVATTQVKPKDSARSTKRKAAATPKTKNPTAKSQPFNPLSMSDEEFLKINDINI